MRGMGRTSVKIVCLILMVVGMGFILYPNVERYKAEYNDKKVIKEIQRKRKEVNTESKEKYETLYQEMVEYNQEIYETHQSDLKDAWSYQQPPFALREYGVVDEAVGYLTINAMDIRLPLFLGAVKENLDKGATVLGQTSMPVGGENTNCVVAAHRGWKGMPLFSDIEKLKEGDEVILDNLWDTLYYRVVEIRIISPDEIDAVKIQKGRDLLTLVTCHPYRYNYQRYVVYCERTDGTSEIQSQTPSDNQKKNKVADSSQKEIDFERTLNKIGLLVMAIALIFCMIWVVHPYCKRKR